MMSWPGTTVRCFYVAGAALCALVALGVVACQDQKQDSSPVPTAEAPATTGPEWFADVTGASPELKKFICRNGEDKDHYTILESLGGGVGVIDFDRDGLLDLVFAGGGDFAGPDEKQIVGYRTRLFKNHGDWTFRDVTEEVLPDQPLIYGHGINVADFDRDGWSDLLITGYGRMALYRNVEVNGKRRFAEVTKEAGLLPSAHFWSTGAAFGDLDHDGWPDLYVCQYVNWSWATDRPCTGQQGVPRDVCSPENFDAKQHALYRNNGKGSFIDVTKDAGLRLEVNDPGPTPGKGRSYCGNGLGAVMVDVNDDGRPDIYVANDGTGNFLYQNKSEPGKISLAEVARTMGAADDMNMKSNGSMGADAADIDGSGQPALWVTNFESQLHALYRPAGGGAQYFYHATLSAGLGVIGKSYVGWGTSFVDLDNDGWMDIAVTNGHVLRHPAQKNLAQMPVLFLNKGSAQVKFQLITDQGGPYFRKPHRGRGLAVADLDNDGRPDLVISHLNEPPAVLKNVYASGNSWLGVKLTAPKHADVVGAKAVLSIGDKKITQFQKGGGSYLSARDDRLLFGLGKAGKAGTLTVHWPAGEPRLEHFEGLASNQYHTIEQGKGKKG